jgi:hypothetical protein
MIVFFCLYRIRIGRNAVEKNASMLAIGWGKSCLMYLDCKGSKIGVCVCVCVCVRERERERVSVKSLLFQINR